jgi:hypothetical protein
LEEYQVAKRRAQTVADAASKSTGSDTPQNDKHRIECSFVGLRKTDWRPAELVFHASHGYYGHGSGYSDMSEATGEYVAKAITALGKDIMRKAAALAAADAESARIAAAAEAREVLDAVQT